MNEPLPILAFGDFELDLERRELRRGGEHLELPPKPLQLLCYLVRHRSRLVSKRELFDRVWPDVIVSESALATALREVRQALGDDGEAQRVIRTLKGHGYGFVADMHEPRVRATVAPIRSLAVLTLENLSGDPGQECFADGMTDSLICHLAGLETVRVLSRTTSKHFKGDSRSLPEIAGELRVDAIVEGTVLRTGDEVRIAAQLIDARTDAHLWSGSYEPDLGDILPLQRLVAQAITESIREAIVPPSGRREARPLAA